MDEHRCDGQAKVLWSASDLLSVFLLTWTLAFFLTEAVTWIFLRNLPIEFRESLPGLIGTLVQDISLVSLSTLWIARRYGVSLQKMLFQVESVKEVVIKGFFGGILILCGVLVVNFVLALLLMAVFHYQPPQQRVIQLLMQSKDAWLFAAYAVLIVLVAPVVEELFFRGLVYTYFRSYYGVRLGILISSLLFGLVHLSIWAFLGTFLGGIALAYLFERSKSLYTSIVAHMVWNGVVTGLLYLSWQFGELPVQ